MLQRVFKALGYERRSESPYAANVWTRAGFASGGVSAASVLSNLGVATAAVRLKAETVASLPLKFYERLPNGDRRRVSDGLARVLKSPNPHQSGFEFIERVSRDLDLAGNFYARIERGPDGAVSALVPLLPSSVSVERAASGNVIYRVSDATGINRVYLEYEILHVRNHSVDGVVGVSPISLARGVLSRGIAENVTAESMAANSLRIKGVVTVPNAKVAPGSKKALTGAFEDDAMHPTDGFGIKVLEGGAKFQPIAFSSADAQFIESRRLSAEDTARVFGVPPASVGIASSVSYGSAEADRRQFVDLCIAPLCARIENALERALLTPEERERHFVEFDLSGLMRAQPGERWAAWRTAIETGCISPNEVRAYENLPAREGGDRYLEPQSLAGSSAPRTE